MNATLSALALAVLGVSLPAQQDTIVWRDGTSTKGAKVTEYNAREIKFRAGGSNQTRGSHEVRTVDIESWRTILGRAGDDPESLVGEAQGETDPFVAQAAYWRAATLYRDAGAVNEEFAVLRAILEKIPTSAYAPEFYRRRIQHYLSQQKPSLKNAESAAEKYGAACRQNAWSKAFELDAELWQKRVASMKSGNVDGFITDLKDLIARAQAPAPNVAIDASADLADAYRTKKEYDAARKAYEALLETKGVSLDVLARAYIGLGYIHSEDAVNAKGDQAAVEQAHYKAFRTFLKVYVNCKDANPTLVAEGLYNAAKACEQWNGMPICKKMAGVLRGRLRLRSPYKETYWAKKK